MSRKTRVAELKPEVLEYIENAALPLSINDVAKHFNISWGTARQVLMELWGEGKIIAELKDEDINENTIVSTSMRFNN